MHGMDSVPVPGVLASAPRVLATGVFIKRFALIQQCPVQSCMALRRRHKANGAMPMLVVVPLHEIGDPLTSAAQVGKRFQRELRPIFQGFEQRFRSKWLAPPHRQRVAAMI